MSEGSHPRGPGPRVQRSGAPQGASPGPRPAGGTPAARAAPEAGSSPLPRASEPRMSPRRDPRRPLSSPPGPSLSLAERGLFGPSSPAPPRPEWPGSPSGPSLCPPAPLHPRPQLLASPGPPGQPEGPRQPGRVAFPLPWPLLPASHPSPLSLPPHRVHQAGRRDPGGPVSVPPAAAQSLPPGKGASFSPPSLRPRLLCTVCKVQPPTPVHGSRAQPRPPLPTLDRPSVHPGHPRPPVSTPVPSRGDFM